VRWRYRLARWISAVLGGLVAAGVVAAARAELAARGLVPDLGFDALAVLLLAVGSGVPWLLVGGLRRRKRRRHGRGP
jgi:ABC-type uncharacterized transport system permease subunit